MKNTSNSFWNRLKTLFKKERDVYFVSGMCYNCSVFDAIKLPKGYNKHYIEWKTPELDESLQEYAVRMSRGINRKGKIILVGYSFGGIVVQEMARFFDVEKIILISTIKKEEEIPSLFQMAEKVNFADNLPMKMYSRSDFMINLFNKYVYNLPTKALEEFMTVTDPVYIKWSLKQITHWHPAQKYENIYHLHGTKDQVFPYEQIVDPITIKGGDHLMIIKRTEQINNILKEILEREEVTQKISA